MSIRRLIIEIDTSEVNVTEFCEHHDVSRSQFYALRRLYARVGEEALEPRSRAPHRVANKTPASVEDHVVALRKDLHDQGLDAGPVTIRWHLRQEGNSAPPSVSAIWRILCRRGFIVPDPKKRPKSAHRFQAERGNEVWQIDGTNYWLADRTKVKIINVVDDCSRVDIASRVHREETAEAARDALATGCAEWGLPERFLSDNGPAFKSLEVFAASIGIGYGHSSPYHPQTCGKVERFHQTMKQWLNKQPEPNTTEELQASVDQFRDLYNNRRPHRSLNLQIPAKVWADAPRSGPANSPLTKPGVTVQTGTVNKRGYLWIFAKAIALGSTHTGKQATATLVDNHIAIFVNGKPVRELDTTPDIRDYPLHPRRGRPTNPDV